MSKLLFIFGFSLLVQSCNSVQLTEKPEQLSEKTVESDSVKTEINPNFQGRLELMAFEKKYESKWDSRPEKFPYSDGSMFKVYKLDCSGECAKSEFKKRKTNGVEIPKKDFNKLVKLLSNPKSYDNSTAACYDPKFGLVVYDSENVPTEFLSICMSCNSSRTYPGTIDVNFENEYLYRFSKSTRNKLREMFAKWGIDYYGFSSFWDDQAEYDEFLTNKNDTL